MFIFLNIEPNEEKLQDCVIRAMTLALAIPYDTAVDMLYKNGVDNDCTEICLDCYSKILEGLGYRMRSACGMSVDELASIYSRSVLIIRIDGHLTCSIDGDIYDIWDCRDKVADCYWFIE